MARPRTASDERILEATRNAVARVGPFRMTLSDVARGAGITASAIVQRFGTKRGLLLRLVRDDVRRMKAGFVRGAATAPLDALVEGLAREAAFSTPESIAGGLAFLGLDVTDPEFRRHALAYLEARGSSIERLLEEARERAELQRVDLEALARAVDVAYHGSLIRWALTRDGTAADAVRRDVEAALAPHRRDVNRNPASGRRGRSPPPSPALRGPRAPTRRRGARRTS